MSKRKGPFTEEIDSYRVPRHLEKPPESLKTYDGTGDPDRHLDQFDHIMQYRNVPAEMKCRIFPLTLDKLASEWFRSLKPNSISTWDQLAKMFSIHFNFAKSKPKNKIVLMFVVQGENEPLRYYIERFNKEASQVRNLDDAFRIFFMTQGLLPGSPFKKHILRWEPNTLQEFLEISQCFINEEENGKTGKVLTQVGPSKPRNEDPRQNDDRGYDGRADRDPRSRNRHNSYTELNVSNTQLYDECCD